MLIALVSSNDSKHNSLLLLHILRMYVEEASNAMSDRTIEQFNVDFEHCRRNIRSLCPPASQALVSSLWGSRCLSSRVAASWPRVSPPTPCSCSSSGTSSSSPSRFLFTRFKLFSTICHLCFHDVHLPYAAL